MSQVPCLHEHLADAARVAYPAALQRSKLDAPLLASGVPADRGCCQSRENKFRGQKNTDLRTKTIFRQAFIYNKGM